MISAHSSVVSREAPERARRDRSLDDGDRAVGREVVEVVVAAHGGSQRRERDGADEIRWVRLPAAPEE